MGANMGRMAGFPRDKAWAQGQVVAQGGRPTRMTVFCLLLDREEDAWRDMSRDEQRGHLEPYLLDGERLHWSNDGELFILPSSAVREPNPSSGKSLEELKEERQRELSERAAERAQQAMWLDAKAKLTRAAVQDAYAQATIDMAAEYVKLERTVLSKALDPDATPAERRMAMAAWRDWKDRHMGKAVAPTEDVTQKPSDMHAFLASEAPSTLPLSASWTPESVAEDQRRELEAGTLAVDEEL